MIICQDSFHKEVMFGSVELIQSHHFSVLEANQVNDELCFNYSRSLDCLCFSVWLPKLFWCFFHIYILMIFWPSKELMYRNICFAVYLARQNVFQEKASRIHCLLWSSMVRSHITKHPYNIMALCILFKYHKWFLK